MPWFEVSTRSQCLLTDGSLDRIHRTRETWRQNGRALSLKWLLSLGRFYLCAFLTKGVSRLIEFGSLGSEIFFYAQHFAHIDESDRYLWYGGALDRTSNPLWALMDSGCGPRSSGAVCVRHKEQHSCPGGDWFACLTSPRKITYFCFG